MTHDEEKTLSTVARQAKDLRATVDRCDSMLRSWARHRKEVAGAVHVSLSDSGATRWYVQAALPAAVIQAELVPVLKRIRDQAARELKALGLPAVVKP